MNVERLRAVQAEEREADSLRALPDTFYREVADYIEGLREQRARAAEAADDPFGSDQVRRLTDEIETVEEVAEAIYERRVGKLVKRASLAAAGVPADEEGLTTEEAELFADLVDQIEAHRAEVLAAFDGDHRGRPPEDASTDRRLEPGAESGRDDPEAGLDVGHAMGSAASPPGTDPAPPGDRPADVDTTTDGDESPGDDADESESTDGGQPDRVTVRITRDVGEVFGVDERVYDLATEDVVTLPAANAKPLLDRDAAEEIE